MKIIGIGGFARCGKDTFVSFAKEILTKNGFQPQRYGFADLMKEEIRQMLVNSNFDLDVYTSDLDAKKAIRPLMVWWGCARRDLSNGAYWVNAVDKILTDIQSRGESTDKMVALISDVRFVNEAKWLKSKNGEFIHLKRYKTHYSESPRIVDGISRNDLPLKTYDVAPNSEEEKNDPLIQVLADQKIEWENMDSDLTPLRQIVFNTLNKSKLFNGTLSL